MRHWLAALGLVVALAIPVSGVAQETPVPSPLFLPVTMAEGLAPLPVLDAPDAFVAWVKAHPPRPVHPEPAYHFLPQILSEMAGFLRDHPGSMRVFEVGHSVDDVPVWGFVIRSPAAPIRKRMLVFAAIHPMEWISSEVALAFAQAVVESPPAGLELTVIPVLNVDGRHRVQADLLAGLDRYWRGNSNHVDLNRNFSVHRDARALWRHIIPGYYAASGPEALSEPETQALDRLAALGGYDLAISLHSFGGFVYAPWTGRWRRPPDWRELHALGTRMVSGQGAFAYRVNQLSRWAFFFRAQGTEIDHIYERYGTPSFLIELTRTGIQPAHPSTWKNSFRRYNPEDPSRHVQQGVALLRAGAIAILDPFPDRRE